MERPFNKFQELINQGLSEADLGPDPATLYEPIRYIMNMGGKRIRPVLTLLAYSLYKEDFQSIIRPAIGLELFHNFTLMHDDIMDQAPLRRGKSTAHKKWNMNQAILSGDAMVVKAYEFFLDLNPDIQNHVLKRFTRCAIEVCEGQQMDMDFEKAANISVDQYLSMIRKKTATLLGFSLELGGLLAEAPRNEVNALYDFGINIGIGFQLKDDLLDIYAEQDKFGKQIGGDIVVNKKTFLLIEALELANEQQRGTLDYWLDQKEFDPDEKVQAVKQVYDQLNIHQITEGKMNEFFDLGFKQLDQLQTNSGKGQLLKHYTELLVNREH